MTIRVAAINTHPIQHFAPLWRELARLGSIALKVLYCSDLGVNEYLDIGFRTVIQWDVDLLGGYDSEFLPIERRPTELGFWQTDNPSVGEALDRFSPDVLVVFGYAHLTEWRALAWARRRNVKVLVFSDSELRHVRSLWKRMLKGIVVRLFFSQVEGALAIGNCNAEYYQHYGIPDRVIYPAAYPADGERLKAAVGDALATRSVIRKRFGINAEEFVFGSFGKYIPRKRHEDVVYAWRRLPDSVRRRSRVMLVGEGALRPRLETLAAEAEGRVMLTGFVNQSAIASFFVACDALVVASDVDAHPLVVTESLFFGLPIIASNGIGCIGPDDTVRDGQNGVTYPCGNIEHLSAAMERFARDANLCRQLGERSREIAKSQNAPAVAQKCANAIQKAVLMPSTKWSQRARRLLPSLTTR